MNESIAVRTRSLPMEIGNSGRVIGWKAHQERSSGVIPSPSPGSLGSGRAVLAPWAIQREILSISSGLTRTSPGGIEPSLSRCSKKLLDGSPASIAGPVSPPASMKRANRRSSLPFFSFVDPWQS